MEGEELSLQEQVEVLKAENERLRRNSTRASAIRAKPPQPPGSPIVASKRAGINEDTLGGAFSISHTRAISLERIPQTATVVERVAEVLRSKSFTVYAANELSKAYCTLVGFDHFVRFTVFTETTYLHT